MTLCVPNRHTARWNGELQHCQLKEQELISNSDKHKAETSRSRKSKKRNHINHATRQEEIANQMEHPTKSTKNASTCWCARSAQVIDVKVWRNGAKRAHCLQPQSICIPTWKCFTCVSFEFGLNWRRYILPRETVMSIRYLLPTLMFIICVWTPKYDYHQYNQ